MVKTVRDYVSELKSAAEDLEGKKLLVPIPGSPDPDAIAAAIFIKTLGSVYGFSVDILCFAQVSHPENLALVKLLDLTLIQHTPDFPIKDYDAYAIVDSQHWSLPQELENSGKELELIFHIDHHKKLGVSPAKFLHIKENAGSTASMCIEYIQKGIFALEKENEEHITLATALAYGVKTDTDNFNLAGKFDYEAISFISDFSDKELLNTLTKQQYTTGSMDIIKVALDNKVREGRFVFAGVRHVRKEDRDSIGVAADFLIRLEGVDTVVTFGLVDNKWIDGSLRTTSSTIDPDDFIKGVFGKDDKGEWYGGGRKEKGGFQIALGLFQLTPNKEGIWDMANDIIMKCLLEKIGASDESTQS